MKQNHWHCGMRGLDTAAVTSIPVDFAGSKARTCCSPCRRWRPASLRVCSGLHSGADRRLASTDSSGNRARRSSLQVNCCGGGIQRDAKLPRRLLVSLTPAHVRLHTLTTVVRCSLPSWRRRTFRPTSRQPTSEREKWDFSAHAVVKLSPWFYYATHKIVDSFDDCGEKRVLNMNERARQTRTRS